MDIARKKTIYKDGYNEVVFKPKTKKVIIGINIYSWNGSKYSSFKCDSEKKAIEISKSFINKHSRKKWD